MDENWKDRQKAKLLFFLSIFFFLFLLYPFSFFFFFLILAQYSPSFFFFRNAIKSLNQIGTINLKNEQRRGVVSTIRTNATTEAATASDPTVAAAARTPCSFDPATTQEYRRRQPKDVRVLVVGPTGYIGKFVVKELIARGYQVVAFSREKSGVGGKADADATRKEFEGADVRFGNVTDRQSLRSVAFDPSKPKIDVVVSCLASRTGGVKDSWDIDYAATKSVLDAAREAGASHFVLLSAICVQKPLLEFQRAKLKLEEELVRAAAAPESENPVSYSIVRPTAFFKSLAGQVALVKEGKPYVMFGDGTLAACKPISESDLAKFMADAVQDAGMANRVLPIGGPSGPSAPKGDGGAWTALAQGKLLFKLAGKEEKFIRVPVAIMDFVISVLAGLSKVFPGLVDAAEFGRIGKYYATESMLVWDAGRGCYDAEATPEYGADTLEAFFEKALQDGGMEGQELGDAGIF